MARSIPPAAVASHPPPAGAARSPAALLKRARAALQASSWAAAAALAVEALQIDETSGAGWHVLAICREQQGDFGASLACYETALKLLPDDADIAFGLGRLAFRFGFAELAEQLFAVYLAKNPGSAQGANNLANAQRAQMRWGDAVETVRAALAAHPGSSLLWNTLGTIVAEEGQVAQSLIFFDEALRLDPNNAQARRNRANSRAVSGDPHGAIADCDWAMAVVAAESERAAFAHSRALILLAQGELETGWDAYEVRLNPDAEAPVHFKSDGRPPWRPGMALAGKRLLLLGEQGLGDEVLFASVAPDLIEALGPDGELVMAVEERLVPLFQRSFPGARVGPHGTLNLDQGSLRAARFLPDDEMASLDAWAPMASPLRRFRRRLEDFPERRSFLTPDPARVAHWRRTLAEAGQGPTIGVVWKSLIADSSRARLFASFGAWAPVLATPGARMVCLQYGDAEAEIAQARTQLGVELWRPPGLDLKNDLDDLAALTCALDLVIGPANAATNLAAACGADVWLIATPAAWPMLGTDRYPWYPQVRVFTPPAFDRWDAVMAEVAEALKAAF